MRDHALGVAEEGEAEERRHRMPEHAAHGADAELDLVRRLRRTERPQVAMRPGVRADRVAAPLRLAHHRGIGHGHAPHHEERRARAFAVERVEDGERVGPQRAVVEGQHDLAVLQEIDVAVLLMAEPRSVLRVDLDHARNAEHAAAPLAAGLCLGGTRSARLRFRLGHHAGERQRTKRAAIPARIPPP